MISQLSKSIRQYMLVTFNYWNFTVTDGALRMLVVLYFHDLGYSTLAIASLFLFYEFFGVVTNLIGGWLGGPGRSGVDTTTGYPYLWAEEPFTRPSSGMRPRLDRI